MGPVVKNLVVGPFACFIEACSDHPVTKKEAEEGTEIYEFVLTKHSITHVIISLNKINATADNAFDVVINGGRNSFLMSLVLKEKFKRWLAFGRLDSKPND